MKVIGLSFDLSLNQRNDPFYSSLQKPKIADITILRGFRSRDLLDACFSQLPSYLK